LFEGLIGTEKDGKVTQKPLDKYFASISNIGVKAQEKGGKILEQQSEILPEKLNSVFSKISLNLGDIFKSLGKSFTDIFSNISGIFQGGQSFNPISAIFSFIGLNNGGIIPSTPYSKRGVDSVPTMLTPGELVIPADKVKSYNNNSGGSTVVNLSITGDISRQTRSEVIKMLPTIATGVNSQNKERNFKSR
jgi:hypothetical protein